MDTLVIALQMALAIVLAVAGIGKLMDLTGSRRAVRGFGVPTRYASQLGTALPLLELALALLLLVGATVRWAAIASGLLFVAFIAAIGWNLRQGRQPDCHCFGQIHSEPAGWSTLTRNALLFAAAVIIAAEGGYGLVDWLAGLSDVASVGLALALLIAVATVAQFWFVKEITHRIDRLMNRLEAMEPHILQGQVAGGVDTGPAVAAAPDFDLPDLNGGRLTLPALLRQRRPLLLLFTDPNCRPCTSLLPDMVEWKRRFGPELEIAFISRGAVPANLEKYGDFDDARVGLQDGFEVSERYGVMGTPSAILVQPDGTIHDPPATGRDDIRGLVARATSSLSPAAQRRLEKNAANLALDIEPNDPLQHLPVSLQVGEPAPRTPLPDLDGRYVSPDDLRGREAVVIFWNPECTFCQRMLPELREWEREPGASDQQVLVISRGTVEQNREQGLSSQVVIDDGFTAGGWVGVSGTPAAVLIDAAGRIASPLVLGEDAILDLLYERTDPVPTENALAVTSREA